MEKEKVILISKIVVPILIALLSFFVIGSRVSSVEYNAKTIHSIDEKKTTVMELTAASTAASAAITLIPGDAATPIADKLVDLSSYFLIVLCALYLEKYLITITGLAAFKILIPIACGLFVGNVFWKNESLQKMAIKLALFGMAIYLVIPTSVKISDMIEATYNSSIQETLDAAKESTQAIEESTEEAEGEEDEEGFFSSLLTKIEGGVSEVTDRFESALNNFIEAIAVMIVTSCVIPIVVLLFFGWVIKLIFGVDIPLPKSNPIRPKKIQKKQTDLLE